MKTSRHQKLARRKRPDRSAAAAADVARASDTDVSGEHIQNEHSDRGRGLTSGGIGAMHRLAQSTGLVRAIDEQVEVLNVHLPYHESDDVLGIAYNVLCGGTCLQDIERRRQDEVYFDALATIVGLQQQWFQ